LSHPAEGPQREGDLHQHLRRNRPLRAYRAWGDRGGQGGGYQDSGGGAAAGDKCRRGAEAAAGVGAQDRGGDGSVGGGAEDRGADGQEAQEGGGSSNLTSLSP